MRLRLQDRRQEADSVFTFVFIPEEPIFWEAGQSIKLELPVGAYDTDEHRFTISSAPYEGHVAITTRTTDSAFKRSLFHLEKGDIINADAIEGDFLWKEYDRPHLFIAGGIGITPFYAMLKDRLHKKLPLNVHLIYNGLSNVLPFLHHIELWQQEYINFKATQRERRLQVGDINTTGGYIYISGPALMVTKTEDLLLDELGVPPHLIKTDQFTGYRESYSEYIQYPAGTI